MSGPLNYFGRLAAPWGRTAALIALTGFVAPTLAGCGSDKRVHISDPTLVARYQGLLKREGFRMTCTRAFADAAAFESNNPTAYQDINNLHLIADSLEQAYFNENPDSAKLPTLVSDKRAFFDHNAVRFAAVGIEGRARKIEGRFFDKYISLGGPAFMSLLLIPLFIAFLFRARKNDAELKAMSPLGLVLLGGAMGIAFSGWPGMGLAYSSARYMVPRVYQNHELPSQDPILANICSQDLPEGINLNPTPLKSFHK